MANTLECPHVPEIPESAEDKEKSFLDTLSTLSGLDWVQAFEKESIRWKAMNSVFDKYERSRFLQFTSKQRTHDWFLSRFQSFIASILTHN